jgi:4-carboxymuconolactone decarboxylase
MTMRRYLITACGLVIAGAYVVAQGGGDQNSAATEARLRETVANLRAGRIATPTNYDRLNGEQKAYVASILSGPRADISGPLGVMMVSPALGDLTQKAMAYSRFAGREGFSSVPPKLNELAILMVGKLWAAEYVWNAHHAYGVRMGLAPETVEAIRRGVRPANLPKDEQAVYDFADEFLRTRTVSDATLNAVRNVLGGDRGIVDLVGTMGLYQISSMMVALDKTPLPQGVKPYFQ